jgi:hypothetical protein
MGFINEPTRFEWEMTLDVSKNLYLGEIMGFHTRKKNKFDIGEQVSKWNNDWKDSYNDMMDNQDIIVDEDEMDDEDDW